MRRSITTRCFRLALGSASALALTIAPYHIAFHGFAPGLYAASAQAGKGGGNGNGGNGGNGNGGNGGNSGGGNSGNGNGNSGNSGNNSGSGDDGSGNPGSGTGQNDQGASSHVNTATGDKIDVDGKKITVQHPDGITEKIENGRFRMEDALGRTIIDRRVTPADISRLKAL
ncbi:hypothetical protein FJ934_16130 [Mesorhizobium sp. B2-4-12]|uniref:hypothetical protein n=1 Tax=unclassified Mesorhizobium TaxID=325217 RepID=UPI0011291AED|nr:MULTISPECIES: hypothetical protein [unclassified Mesorhizobium]TPK94013.1 hypothetical protein FJ934_16130 [Mesorhizobium sp. B2-4-12]TPK96839.1 hypothetical protein FJ938_26915 [Mesorhizobium sp. B2-4-14]